jgi:aminoglycoside phosphotransferase (APT) family kinase protein
MNELHAGGDPNMDRLLEWLPAHIPAADERTTLVHGDFRIDNVIFHPVEPRILAVLDWELSTLGHPLADFAYHLMMYRLPPLLIAGLAGVDLHALNIPDEMHYVREYCRRTGRQRIDHLEFYLAFNMFRLAAIVQGIKGRFMRGTAVSTQARRMVEALPFIAERAWLQAQAVEI